MPVITVAKTELFRVLGEEFSKLFDSIPLPPRLIQPTADDEFSDLCFKFGIELDDIVSILGGSVSELLAHI